MLDIKKVAFVGLVIAVIGAVVGLVIMLDSSPGDVGGAAKGESTSRFESRDETEATAARSSDVRLGSRIGESGREARESAASDGSGSGSGSGSNSGFDSEGSDANAARLGTETTVRTYVRPDGVIVRDHRKGNPPPPDLERVLPRPGRPTTRVSSDVVMSVRSVMKPAVQRCARELDEASFGEKPSVQGRVVVSVESGELTVNRVVITVRDVDDEQGIAALKSCVREPMEVLELDVPGEDDVTDYSITMAFSLRKLLQDSSQ